MISRCEHPTRGGGGPGWSPEEEHGADGAGAWQQQDRRRVVTEDREVGTRSTREKEATADEE